MIEPEVAFADMEANMRIAEQMVKATIGYVMEECLEEMKFFQERIDGNVMQRMNQALNAPFNQLTYDEAIKILEKANHPFEFPIGWGLDLQKEHEKYLVEKVFNGCPTFVTHYPKQLKPFYMKVNEDGRTVQAMDLLVPTIGELIGGSVREERLNLLENRMREMGLKIEDYDWYLDLRRYGTVPHAGFGMGFERFIQYITGMENIRDVVPVPRYRGSCRF
jgi:asparaginyl-tRNA synthetase